MKHTNQGTESRFTLYNKGNQDKRRAYEETVRRTRRSKDRDRMREKRGKAKRFISWDGEGTKVPDGERQPYVLFGYYDSKTGKSSYAKSRQLQTVQCLNHILRSPKDAIHFGFAFGYDVNQILCDLNYGALAALAYSPTNSCRWNGFRIEYLPGKWFKVSRVGVPGSTRTIYDVFSFFNRSLANTLEQFGVGPWRQISQSHVLNVVQQLDSDLTLAQKTTRLCTLLNKWPTNAPITRERNGTSGAGSEIALALEAMDYLSEVEIVALFKEERSNFTYQEIQLIRRYWEIELRYMVELMETMRGLFNEARFFPTSWHGPGALARQLLKNNGIKACKSNTREEWPQVWIAAQYGYAAGRFQQWLAGHVEDRTVYNYDIHSAYPYAIQFLPDLSRGKWQHNLRVDRSRIRAERFCIYHIRYDATKIDRKDPRSRTLYADRPRPLFRRLKNNNIYWPDAVEGWFWSPEAELVANDPAATFVESWEFEDNGRRPFAFIATIYETRERNKAAGRAIEYAFKLAMNSCYGQFAQRAGWRNQRPPGPPPYHQLEWAGYLTSMCRAMVHKVAAYAYEQGGLITIDTDGVFSLVEIPDEILPNGIGDGLGQWDVKKYEGMIIWQNGFYALKLGGKWKQAKSRGAPRGTIPMDAVWKALDQLEPIRYDKTTFIGFRHALNQPGLNWRSWTPVPHEVVFGGGPGSKMQHRGSPDPKKHSGRCHKCIGISDHPMHNLIPRNVGYGEYHGKYVDTWTYKHRLPWLHQDEKTADFVDDDEELAKIFEDVNL